MHRDIARLLVLLVVVRVLTIVASPAIAPPPAPTHSDVNRQLKHLVTRRRPATPRHSRDAELCDPRSLRPVYRGAAPPSVSSGRRPPVAAAAAPHVTGGACLPEFRAPPFVSVPPEPHCPAPEPNRAPAAESSFKPFPPRTVPDRAGRGRPQRPAPGTHLAAQAPPIPAPPQAVPARSRTRRPQQGHI